MNGLMIKWRLGGERSRRRRRMLCLLAMRGHTAFGVVNRRP